MNTLWVTADDFGLHADINAGIIQCALSGRIHAVSVCASGRCVDWEALRVLASRGVQIGLHLTWVGEPWLSNPKIMFYSWRQIALVRMCRTEFQKQMAAEAFAQLQAFLQRGLRPNHIDAHQHVHMLPGFFEIASRVAEKAGAKRIRIPWVPAWRLVRPSFGGVVLQALSAWRKKQVRHFWPCIGIAHSGHNTPEILLRELKLAKGWNVELVTHPGCTTKSLIQQYGHWKYDWDVERRLLLDQSWPERLWAEGYSLGT